MFNGGVRGKRAKDGVGFLSTAEQFNQKSFLVPTVTSFSVTDVSYVPLDNTAVNTAGGETIVINGSGFASGATVQVGATTIGSVTFIDQNRLAFTAPALSSGSYTIYVTNSNGGTGILLSGLVYSGLPTFTTTAGSLGAAYETANINISVVATGDAPITYSLLSGTLPTGTTLNSNGTITGNAPVDSSSTTYSFTIQASDAQLQDTTRAFTLTINTDVVTWITPAAGNAYSVFANSAPISNVSLSASSAAGYNITYAANTLPTGVSLSGNTIFGTPTVEQTVYTALTATAATTGRSASRFISWIVSGSFAPKIGTTTYDVTGIGAVTDISQIASNTSVMAELPSSGYLKYIMRIGSNNTPITVSFRKINSTTLSQSAFSLLGQSMTITGTYAILQGEQDDHDAVFMDADGKGVLARTQIGFITGGPPQTVGGPTVNFTKFSGLTTVVANNPIDSVVTYPVSSFIPAMTGGNSTSGTLVSFPLTTSGVWINITSGTYKTNNFSGTALPGTMASVLATGSTGSGVSGSVQNSLYTISDGVNQFIIGRYGVTSAFFCKVDLTTGAITATAITYSSSVAYYVSAGTEEDPIGDQLFTVDCFTTFNRETTFYYGGTKAWNDTTGMPFDLTGKSTVTSGPGVPSGQTQQSGIDLFGSVDSNGFVWMADWGHDNGGLFNVGNDIELGTSPTNIKLLPTNYTN